MKFREDTSFPFLAIARRWGVSYREVLAIADACEKMDANMLWSFPITSFGVSDDVRVAVAREHQRRCDVSARDLGPDAPERPLIERIR